MLLRVGVGPRPQRHVEERVAEEHLPGDALREFEDLFLDVSEEGVRVPASLHHDCVGRGFGEVHHHRAAGAVRVCADLGACEAEYVLADDIDGDADIREVFRAGDVGEPLSVEVGVHRPFVVVVWVRAKALDYLGPERDGAEVGVARSALGDGLVLDVGLLFAERAGHREGEVEVWVVVGYLSSADAESDVAGPQGPRFLFLPGRFGVLAGSHAEEDRRSQLLGPGLLAGLGGVA